MGAMSITTPPEVQAALQVGSPHCQILEGWGRIEALTDALLLLGFCSHLLSARAHGDDDGIAPQNIDLKPYSLSLPTLVESGVAPVSGVATLATSDASLRCSSRYRIPALPSKLASRHFISGSRNSVSLMRRVFLVSVGRFACHALS